MTINRETQQSVEAVADTLQRSAVRQGDEAARGHAARLRFARRDVTAVIGGDFHEQRERFPFRAQSMSQ